MIPATTCARAVAILRPVQPRLKRGELDPLAKFYSLDPPRVETLLSLADARPTRLEGRIFLANVLRISGVLSLAAGLVFFVAANWSEIAIFGRFALVELVLVACGAIAFWEPPPAFVGRAALFLAFFATGALLALFGQTYQTGADVYELFFGWTLLGLPLVVAARWSVSTAAWVLVLNTALMLYCGWQPAGGLLWTLLGSTRFQPTDLIMGAAWLNLLLWLLAEWRRPDFVPDWVRRLLVSCAFLFASWSGVLAAVDGPGDEPGVTFAPLGLLVAWGLTIFVALRRREDIYPLAMVMGSFLAVSMVWMAKAIDPTDEGVFLFFALYLVGVSTAGGKVLLTLFRRWRAPVTA
jgi:uncharacterized membrane protein